MVAYDQFIWLFTIIHFWHFLHFIHCMKIFQAQTLYTLLCSSLKVFILGPPSVIAHYSVSASSVRCEKSLGIAKGSRQIPKLIQPACMSFRQTRGTRNTCSTPYPIPPWTNCCSDWKAGHACIYRMMHLYESKYRHSVNLHMKKL